MWCEVVPPFNLMPREFLEASCNAVLATTTSLLLPVFLRRLAQDYQKWAADPAYRNQVCRVRGSCITRQYTQCA